MRRNAIPLHIIPRLLWFSDAIYFKLILVIARREVPNYVNIGRESAKWEKLSQLARSGWVVREENECGNEYIFYAALSRFTKYADMPHWKLLASIEAMATPHRSHCGSLLFPCTHAQRAHCHKCFYHIFNIYTYRWHAFRIRKSLIFVFNICLTIQWMANGFDSYSDPQSTKRFSASFTMKFSFVLHFPYFHINAGHSNCCSRQ